MKAGNLRFKYLTKNNADNIQQGYNSAVQNLFKEYFKDKILFDPASHLECLVQEDMDDFCKWATSRKKVARYRYVFLVINLRPGITIQQVALPISKAIKKKYIKWYMYNHEQRSKTYVGMGKGLHLNFLIELDKNKSPWQVKTEFYNTFKNYVGNKMHVVHRYSNDKTNFVNYIKGIKTDKDKKDMVKVDQRWRQSNNLLPFYETPTVSNDE